MTNKFSPEVCARAVRMVLDHAAEHRPRWQVILSIAVKVGCTGQTLNAWLTQAERDSGRKPGLTTDMVARLTVLERENRELRQVNEILRKASAYFAHAPLGEHRCSPAGHGELDRRFKPICKVLPIAPSTYHAHAARRSDSARQSPRVRRDATLMPKISRMLAENFRVDGVRKVWRQLLREGHAVAGFVLDALEQALHDRRPIHRGGLEQHSDRGSQFLSIEYTERLAEASVAPSVASVRDSYDNALAETINGLYKAEVIHRCAPWRPFEAVKFATLEWVDWFNNRRLLESIGNIRPAEAEEHHYARMDQFLMAA